MTAAREVGYLVSQRYPKGSQSRVESEIVGVHQMWEDRVKVDGKPWRTIWTEAGGKVGIIDQTRLPFEFVTTTLTREADAVRAIRDMQVRGAPLIGAAAAYGLALAMGEDPSEANLDGACERLAASRPTAVNLRWALRDVSAILRRLRPEHRAEAAFARAAEIVEEDVEINRQIGLHGLTPLQQIADRKGRVNVLTHCNAGWLATCDWGTATGPIYQAHDAGIDLHVWVDETRPRNQGGHLTAWELHQQGVPHTVIVDNAGGHLMQHGQVDICLVGTGPHHTHRRCLQQDRHLSEGAGRPRQRCAVLCQPAQSDH